MSFQDQLYFYLSELNCSLKELSDATDGELSVVVLSRYKNGNRIPGRDSEQLVLLSNAITQVAEQHDLSFTDHNEILSKLQESIDSDENSYPLLCERFGTICNQMSLNMKDIANAMAFDVSFLYRVKSGERRPMDAEAFAKSFGDYIGAFAESKDQISTLSEIIEIPKSHLFTSKDISSAVCEWLLADRVDGKLETLDQFDSQGQTAQANQNADNFLHKMNEFNLDDYIKAIHFDELKVPTLPFTIPKNKEYYGLDGFRDAELDFFKATVLSKESGPVYMCADMPMEDLAEDKEWSKKWMFGLAMMLKKGLDIHIMHNLDRPFEELMLGLEGWMPMYMTGLVHPSYMPYPANDVFQHLHYVSEVAALTGECITGHHADGKYKLMQNKTDLAYYRTRTMQIMEKSKHLMDIYLAEQREAFLSDFKSCLTSYIDESDSPRIFKTIWPSLPLYTMSEELLLRILQANDLTEKETSAVLNYYHECRIIMDSLLESCEITDRITLLSQAEFEEEKPTVPLFDIFFAKEIKYPDYATYNEHISQIRSFAMQENYHLEVDEKPEFGNMIIQMAIGSWVKVSKAKSPAIHFIIYNPLLREAIENIRPAMTDEVFD